MRPLFLYAKIRFDFFTKLLWGAIMNIIGGLFFLTEQERGGHVGITSQGVYITKIQINELRHLQNIKIELCDVSCEERKKHLVLTGRNGAGKTSLLNSLWDLLKTNSPNTFFPAPLKERVPDNVLRSTNLTGAHTNGDGDIEVSMSSDSSDFMNMKQVSAGREEKRYGIFRFFPAERFVHRGVRVQLESMDKLRESVKHSGDYKAFLHNYMATLNYQRLHAYYYKDDEAEQRKNSIDKWFGNFESVLRDIYDCRDLVLIDDPNDFVFYIQIPGKPKFPLTKMADGYNAFMDLLSELLITMEIEGAGVYNMPGIVVIDEIETHMHIDLQKKVLPFLTRMFPAIQFIVSTHSPFVMSSVEDAVVFDMETQKRYEDMTAYSYESIVENYFGIDMYSEKIKRTFSEYSELAELEKQGNIDEASFDKLEKLSDYLERNVDNKSRELRLAFNDIKLSRMFREDDQDQ